MESELIRSELPYGPEIDDGILILHRPFARSARTQRNYSLGVMIDVKPINIDLASDSEADILSTRWGNLLRSQPVGSVIDTRLDSCPGHGVPEWEKARADLSGEHIDWQRRHVQSGMRHTHEGRGYALRKNYTTIGIHSPSYIEMPLPMVSYLRLALIWRSKQAQAYFDERVEDFMGEKLRIFKAELSSFVRGLSELGLEPTVLSGQSLLDRLSLQFDPISKPPEYVKGVPLRDQLGTEPIMLTDNGAQIGKRKARMLTPGRGVNNTFPGILSATRAPEGYDLTLDLGSLNPDGYFSTSVVVAIPDPGDVINSLEDRQAKSWMQRVGYKGQVRADVDAQGVELSDLILRVTSGEEALVPTGVRMQVWDTGDELAREFLTRLTTVGIIGSEEKYVGSTLYLQGLSLGTDMTFPDNGTLQGLLSIPSTNAAHLTPVWGCFSGNGSPDSTLFLDTLGNPFYFDAFADPGSPHGYIVGLTRYGKSAATNTILHQLLPKGGYAFIIDRYGSYEELCRIHGGKHYSLSLENPICLGLMDGPLDATHRATVMQALVEMCSDAQEGTSLNRIKRAILSVMLRRWSRQVDRDKAPVPTLTGFVEAFDDLVTGIPGGKALADELKVMLMPYYGDGEFAPFIDGKNELKVDGEHLVSVDIAGLLDVKEIESVMVALFFMRFGSIIRNPELQGIPKYMIADEVAFLLNSPATAKFFLTMSRALARFKCSLLTISQFLTDFDTPAGQVIVDMAGYALVFRLNDNQKRALDKHGYNKKAQDLIYNLTRTNDSATCYIKIKNGDTGVARIVAPPEFLAQIGQEDEHKEERKRMDEGLVNA